jgi:hypothetical protein
MTDKPMLCASASTVRVGQQIVDKRLVNFELIKWQSVEISQRRISGVEIVQRKADAQLFES